MLDKDFELVASAIRDRKRSAKEIGYSAHSQTSFDIVILVTNDLQDRLADAFEKEYKSFDRDKFNEACRLDGLTDLRDQLDQKEKIDKADIGELLS